MGGRGGPTSARAAAIAERFACPRAIDAVQPHGDGLINTTFLVKSGDSRYILQRINDTVFPEPEKIMSNLASLERHLATHKDPGLRIPALIANRDGQPFIRDAKGGIWRLMDYVPNTKGLSQIDDMAQAREVGRILGRFHLLTNDLPTNRLAVTLPGFHVTPTYLERFNRILEGRRRGHPSEVEQAIAFVTERQGRAGVLEEARRQGQIPERVIHGDPKLDNVLFDRTTGRALCLIDLDTVQPGLVHYDLGDCLRSCCNRAGESANGDQVTGFDLALCGVILEAYAHETRGILGTAEIGLIPDAIRLIPFELGLRFLTDHLEGNRYFRVSEPGQNLRKARIQFSLVEDIEAKEPQIRDIVAESFLSGESTR